MQKQKRQSGHVIYCAFFSLIFSILFALQRKVVFSGDIYGHLDQNYFRSFDKKDLLAAAIFFIACNILLNLACRIIRMYKDSHAKKWNALYVTSSDTSSSSGRSDSQLRQGFLSRELFRNDRTVWLIGTILLEAEFVFLLISSYPGSVIPDSFSSINQALGTAPYTNHHPILYTLLVKLFIDAGLHFFHDISIGIFLFSLFQCTLVAITLGYFLYWLRKRGVPDLLLIVVLAFFLIARIYAVYAISIQKDTLFSLSCFLLCLFLYDFRAQGGWTFLRKKEKTAELILLLFFVAFLRNNGFIIDIVVCAMLLIRCRKKALALLLLSFLIVVGIVQGPVFTRLGLSGDRKTESLGIPIQQMAYTLSVKEPDAAFRDEDLATLENIMPLSEWQSAFTPCLVDPIKWDSGFRIDYFESHVTDFLQAWFHGLRKAPGAYLKEYALQTYGFWSFGTTNSYGFCDNYVQANNGIGLEQKNLILELTGLDLRPVFDHLKFPDGGTLFWILLISLFFSGLTKGRRSWITFLPAFTNWLTIMAATPVAFSLRYVFVFAYLLPWMALMPFVPESVRSES